MKTPILGSSYVARSPNAADSRMVNLFPEIVPEQGKDPAFLQRTPGLVDTEYLSTVPLSVKALYSMTNQSGVEYLIIARSDGQVFYTSGGPIALAGIMVGTGQYSISDNGSQVFLSSGSNGYVFNINTFAWTQVTGPSFGPNNLACGTVTYLDGFFVFNKPGTQRIHSTGLLDGTSIDPLDYRAAEASPDVVMGIIANNGELWIFGRSTIEVWAYSGGDAFPFSPIQGAYNEVGCVSAASIAKLDNSVFWLGRDGRGAGTVYRTNGYRAERISTHAIEWQIQRYGDMSDAVAYTYQQDGHAFYVISFPTGDATFVYDVATQAWHERGSDWDGTNYHRTRSNCYTFFDGQHIVGDYDNGLVYVLDPDTFTENGSDVRWMRSWRALGTGLNTLKRSAHHSLQLDAAFGPDATSVQLWLRWSDNGGLTWNAPRDINLNVSSGSFRLMWRRLGMTMKLRDRVYEVSAWDANPAFIMGAELIASLTNA